MSTEVTLDPAALFHHGIVVGDLAGAIETVGRELGLTFSQPWPARQRIRTPDGTAEVDFEISYSAQGPVHIELVQAQPGTIWSVEGPGVLHHLGYWSDDLAADGDALERAGLEFVFENVPDEGQEPSYRYYRSALGYYVELVHSSLRPVLEGLWESTLADAR